jgi:hypothetical protein
VAQKKGEYKEKMALICVGGGRGDPCAKVADMAGSGGLEAGEVAQRRNWVRREMVAVDAAADADDRRLREQLAKLLLAPVDQAEKQSVAGCEGQLRGQLAAAVERFPARPPWTLEQLEAILAPERGAVWQYCNETLAPFFNCVALKPKPNAPVRVPGDIVSFLNRAERLSRLLFDSSGGWRTHTISFQSVLSSSVEGARVTRTALSVSCSNLLEQPWAIQHRQTLVQKTLSWRPDQCAEAKLQVTLGSPEGGFAAERTVEIKRDGPFALLELLGVAERAGSEFRWTFPGEQVTAAFRVSLSDPALLDYKSLTLPR